MIGERIQQILEAAGIDTKNTKRSVVIDCPACGGDSKCYVLWSNGKTKCMKCETYWSASALLSAILKISIIEANAALYKGDVSRNVEQGLTLNINGMSASDDDEALTDDDFDLPEIEIDPLFVPVENSDSGMKYLESRGVTDLQLIRTHGILYSAIMNAVIFLIRDENGRLVGWQARYLTPFNPKMRMMTYQGLNKARILYNYTTNPVENLILVEGPFDCLKTDIEGFPSVASLGKGISDFQVEMLINSPAKNIYIGLDRDAGLEAKKLASKLGRHKNVYRLLSPDHRDDFGDCTKEEVIECISKANLIHDGEPMVEVHLK